MTHWMQKIIALPVALILALPSAQTLPAQDAAAAQS
jgi:hypothetical protein